MIAALGLCAAAWLACGPSGEDPVRPEPVDRPRPVPQNVLLITIDTLRHDRLGYAGHTRETSPHIDRLANEGVVFSHAYSQSGWTLPSMASVLTGRSPAAHGATHFNARIDASLPTLATILTGRGYSTHGLVSHILLRPRYGFDAGFAAFDTSVLRLGRPKDVKSAEPLTDRAIAAISSNHEPFFVWVHYFDPHNDYMTDPRFAAFGDDASGRYDQEIAATDAAIGRLMGALEESGRADRTVVVLTADHGEELGDHGGVYHYTLHEEVVRIPLVVRAPGQTARIDDTAAQQIDVLPTILAAAGLMVNANLPGRNLLEDGEAPPVFIERQRPSGFDQRAMIDAGRKLVVIEAVAPDPDAPATPPTPTPVENVAPGVYYYDLEHDPEEHTPLDPADDPIAAAMLEAMARHFESIPAGAAEAVELDAETEAALRALGYLK